MGAKTWSARENPDSDSSIHPCPAPNSTALTKLEKLSSFLVLFTLNVERFANCKTFKTSPEHGRVQLSCWLVYSQNSACVWNERLVCGHLSVCVVTLML